jgi:hypothetical protein
MFIQPSTSRLSEYLEDLAIESDSVIQLMEELWLKLSINLQKKIAGSASFDSDCLLPSDFVLLKDELRPLITDENLEIVDNIQLEEKLTSLEEKIEFILSCFEFWIQQETYS